MGTILVTGGAGKLGSEVVARLVAGSHRTRILSHRDAPAVPAGVEVATGDLVSGAGLREALAGVDAIIHTASDARDTQAVDVSGTQRLLAAIQSAQADDATRQPPHLIYISIVGIDRSAYPYYLAKLAAESLIIQSGLPWSILRTTQFHSFAEQMLQTLGIDDQPQVSVPAGVRLQPIASEEVADRLVAIAELGPLNHIAQMGGPEILSLESIATTYLRIRAREATPVESTATSDLFATFRTGINLIPDHAFGLLTWADHLARRFPR